MPSPGLLPRGLYFNTDRFHIQLSPMLKLTSGCSGCLSQLENSPNWKVGVPPSTSCSQKLEILKEAEPEGKAVEILTRQPFITKAIVHVGANDNCKEQSTPQILSTLILLTNETFLCPHLRPFCLACQQVTVTAHLAVISLSYPHLLH